MVEKPCLDGHRVRSLGGGFIPSGKRKADFLSGEIDSNDCGYSLQRELSQRSLKYVIGNKGVLPLLGIVKGGNEWRKTEKRRRSSCANVVQI